MKKSTPQQPPGKSHSFFIDPRLPQVEARRTERSSEPFKAHLHRRASVGAILQGRVRYQVAGQEERLEPGALALINPETLHSCNAAAKEERSYLMLYLDPLFCLELQRAIWAKPPSQPFARIKLVDQQIYGAFCTMMATLMAPGPPFLEKEEGLYLFLAELFARIGQGPKRQGQERLELAALKEVLQGDLAMELSLTSLAKAFATTPYTLIRRFKAATGVTPHAYRMNCRIERARALLQEGCEISETAFLCGFFDQSHFHRHFKAMTALTPGQYQRNFMQ